MPGAFDGELDIQAKRCAARVPASVGLSPAVIIKIITEVLPLLASCFNRNDETDSAEVRREVINQNSVAPNRLRRRMSRRIRGEATDQMTRKQSFALAEGVIQEVMASDNVTVGNFCAAIGYEKNAE